MRMVQLVCRSLWLGIVIAALVPIGAIARDIALAAPDATTAVAFSGVSSVAQVIVRPRGRSITPNTAGDAPADPAARFATQPPRVRSFALLPQPDEHIAQLRIEFADDVRLPRELELQLDKTSAPAHLSAKNVATIPIEFDVDGFLREQAARSAFARRGALVPMFDMRHFKGFEGVQFIDPEQVHTAIRLKKFIPIANHLFAGIPTVVDPSRELMITDPRVVEDPSRTFDVCAGTGNATGAWTFNTLFTEVANDMIDPAELMESWLDLWLTDQSVNGFQVPARAAGMQSLLLNNWPRTNGRLDLTKAPMRLLAIVNRLDLRGNAVYGGDAGEARFVFGVIDRNDCTSLPSFTIILEYGVPRSGCTAVHDWAVQWHSLSSAALGTATFNDALQKITDQFAGRKTAPSKPNASALNQLRTNDFVLNSPWELREFHLDPTSHKLVEATVAQTPDLSLNLTSTLTDYINKYQQNIISQNHIVWEIFETRPFRGGNAPNNFMFWNSSPPPRSYDARHFFSRATCSGCHGRETNTSFTHISPRPPGAASPLSQFLIGLGTLTAPEIDQVTDPVNSTKIWEDGDLLRRQQDLAALIGSDCTSGGFLPAIAFQPLNSPH